jgi:hypothetical protein
MNNDPASGVDPALTTPDADHQIHRNQDGLEEDVEQHEIIGAKHAHRHGLQQQRGDHEFAHARGDRPAGKDGDGREKRGQHDQQQADAIDTHAVLHVEPGEPGVGLDELKPGLRRIEPYP